MIMEKLPEKYKERMKRILGAEWPAFLDSYGRPETRGLRVNTLKISPEEFEKKAPFPVRRIPWTDNGFFYDADVRPAQHPFYAAGLYYLQEPSAMTPAGRLPVEKGDKILDLCAAPGGKTTELAARLAGSGLLAANDIHNGRAKALLRNLELFGTKNLLVLNETPDRLRSAFPGYFDKILVDAPCSGEGMMRKNPAAAGLWSEKRITDCAKQQKEILACAHGMLKPGGYLLYSTCTFAPEENECNAAWLLEEYPDMEICPVDPYEGFENGRPDLADGNPALSFCVRIYPHKMEGEGHFLVLFRKKADPGNAEDAGSDTRSNTGKTGKEKTKTGPGRRGKSTSPGEAAEYSLLKEFLEEGGCSLSTDGIVRYGTKAYLKTGLPESAYSLSFLRSGLYVGEWKKNRFEPSQPFAMSLSKKDYPAAVSFREDDERLARYLKGETVLLSEDELNALKPESGWLLVCADEYPVGWGKRAGDMLKNKLPAAWRQ